MIFAEGNHSWKSFFLLRDAFRRRKSSLGELFSSEGCISQKKIISGRAFFCRGMHFAEGNHLWKSFFLQRDAFRGRKSSLLVSDHCQETIPGNFRLRTSHICISLAASGKSSDLTVPGMWPLCYSWIGYLQANGSAVSPAL